MCLFTKTLIKPNNLWQTRLFLSYSIQIAVVVMLTMKVIIKLILLGLGIALFLLTFVAWARSRNDFLSIYQQNNLGKFWRHKVVLLVVILAHAIIFNSWYCYSFVIQLTLSNLSLAKQLSLILYTSPSKTYRIDRTTRDNSLWPIDTAVHKGHATFILLRDRTKISYDNFLFIAR